jgi:hypothetical protein
VPAASPLARGDHADRDRLGDGFWAIGDHVIVHPESWDLEDLTNAEGVVEAVFKDWPLAGAWYVRLGGGQMVAIGPAAMELAP